MAMNYTGYGQMGSPIAYSFGGGTIGGPNLWDFSFGRPQLSQTAQLLGVQLLPAGATSRQELRYLKEEAQRSGRPYVEAPTQYVFQRDRRGLPMYINPLTGQTLGTMTAEWSGSSKTKESEEEKANRKRNIEAGVPWFLTPKEREARLKTKEKEDTTETKPVPQTAMGFSGGAMAFTPFGAATGVRPTLASPYAGGFGVPSFPF